MLLLLMQTFCNKNMQPFQFVFVTCIFAATFSQIFSKNQRKIVFHNCAAVGALPKQSCFKATVGLNTILLLGYVLYLYQS